ncbi:hypothetical protein [Trueperella sp. LYQ141]|uniref:TPM domain-containing protein n=1 Tax=Trueperella sp. LYQ141 TaxID=3391058 RepID=UPI0039837F80
MNARRILSGIVFVFAALIFPTTALAAEPLDELNGHLDDRAKVITDASSVRDAIDEVPGQNLWVVIVPNTGSMDVEKWARKTHERAHLDESEALYVISVDTSEVAWYAHKHVSGVSYEAIDAATDDHVLSLMTDHEWDKAIIALAKNVHDEVKDGGSSTSSSQAHPVNSAVTKGLIGIGAGGLVGFGAYTVITRKKRKESHEQATQKTIRDASSELLDIDNAVRAAANELDFAQAEFGVEATRRFSATLQKAQQATSEAFQLHSRLHDTSIPLADTEKIALSQHITELVGQARTALEKHTTEFSTLRQLASDVEKSMSTIATRASEITARLKLGTDALDNLAIQYPPSVLKTLETYPQQITTLLTATDQSLTHARQELEAGDRNAAVPYVAMANKTIDEASSLAELLINAPTELDKQRATVQQQIDSLSADVRDAQRLAPDDPSVQPFAQQATQVLERARTEKIDPFAISVELHETETRIDQALAPFRQADENRQKLEDRAQQARQMAVQAIDDVDATISRYRAGVRGQAREQLSRARSFVAQGDEAQEPAAKLEYYEAARKGAQAARDMMWSDMGGSSGGQSLGETIISGLVHGIVSGAISGAYRGYGRRSGGFGGFGSGGSGGFGSGGFGSSGGGSTGHRGF